MKNLIAVIANTTSSSHSLLATEALKKTAAVLGVSIKVEEQSSGVACTPLTNDDIAIADAVLLASDLPAERLRFADKLIYETSIADALSTILGATQQLFSPSLLQSGGFCSVFSSTY